jgi:predicted anti-sigma-YlaC factor YlaD
MDCDKLFALLNTEWSEQSAIVDAHVTAHICSCPHCHHGLVRLAETTLAADESCARCRARFPAYYEITHVGHPLVTMSDKEVSDVVIHLEKCPSCREEYEVLVELVQVEEDYLQEPT